MGEYSTITELSRVAIMNAYFKKGTFTGGDTYLSFYETEDPQYEVTSIGRRLIPASGWSVARGNAWTTRVTNNSAITFGPLSTDVTLTGYLITNAATGPVYDYDEFLQLTENSTGIMAVRFPAPDYFSAKEGNTLKIPSGYITIDLAVEAPV